MAFYCDPCDRWFQSWSSYKQHMSMSPFHNYCADCNRDFDSGWALEQHFIQSPNHHYCRECGTHFEDDDDLTTHCVDDHYYCERCKRFFKSAHGLHEHNRQSHYYCEACRRVFNSLSNLRAHLNSSVHRPRNVPCAFQHHGCAQLFINKSSMISHLENGGCPSGATRKMINRWVQLNDRNNTVTVPRRLLTNGDDIEYIATERSWNGYAYECVLCHSTFGALADLNRHLASPRHQERMYRCPLQTCLMRFNTLSGLCQHVESESCGILKFRAVREGMDDLLRDMGRLRLGAP
ncbi:hypothetical protein EV363DRAFT_1330402 [Boletus edulis]|nr:hypothetical protein EV363DRAFT_1330402 [Boletus edulis]